MKPVEMNSSAPREMARADVCAFASLLRWYVVGVVYERVLVELEVLGPGRVIVRIHCLAVRSLVCGNRARRIWTYCWVHALL